jgi:hypothetical protein
VPRFRVATGFLVKLFSPKYDQGETDFVELDIGSETLAE